MQIPLMSGTLSVGSTAQVTLEKQYADKQGPVAYLVEADVHYLATLTRTLRDAGFIVKRNTTGQNVLSYLECAPQLPALVILSFDLALYSPLDLARSIRHTPRLSGITLLGIGEAGVLKRGSILEEQYLHYFDEFIAKPLSRKRLLEFIDDIAASAPAASPIAAV